MSEYIYTTEGAFGLRECTGEKIVRCKDCEFFADNLKECMRLDEWDSMLWFSVEPDGFCAWGERREDE